MRANEILSEIMRMSSFTPHDSYGQWRGQQMKPLPGGSGFKYRVEIDSGISIYIGDPAIKENVASLLLSRDYIISGAYHVSIIKVSKKYQRRGLAKALYGIALTILKITLVAGDTQSPGGRRNWASLFKIPGCEVLGYVCVSEVRLDSKFAGNEANKLIDEIMMLGGQYYGRTSSGSPIFLFPVTVGKDELQNALKKSKIPVYDETYKMTTGLMAKWAGK